MPCPYIDQRRSRFHHGLRDAWWLFLRPLQGFSEIIAGQPPAEAGGYYPWAPLGRKSGTHGFGLRLRAPTGGCVRVAATGHGMPCPYLLISAVLNFTTG